jgi:Phosphodiester glycosidase
MTPIWVSLGSALANPALGLGLSARGAEWLRDHGGGGIVNAVENWWYSNHPPPVGGTPAVGNLPSTGVASAAPPPASASVPHLPAPAPLVPFAHPRLQGEGVWVPAGRRVAGIPAVYTTFMRPDSVHTSVVDGVAWMDTRLLSATLYSGSYIPGGGPYVHTAPIPPAAARTLVTAFNAGFRMQDANGGYYTQGRLEIPLRPGAASFVIDTNGSVRIGAWDRGGLTMSPRVAAVRQNLNLLLQGGHPVPGLHASDTTQWGSTLGNQIYVSRSGVGVTRDGALVYVGGPNLNITDLANLLVRAGAVTAMELDINTDWVNFATFSPPSPRGLASPLNGTDLLPLAVMSGPSSRYFESWWSRDFFTMSARAVRRSG